MGSNRDLITIIILLVLFGRGGGWVGGRAGAFLCACVRGCVGAWVHGCVGACVRGWVRGWVGGGVS